MSLRAEFRAIGQTIRFHREPVHVPSRTNHIVAVGLGLLVLIGAMVTYLAVTRGGAAFGRDAHPGSPTVTASVPVSPSAVRASLGHAMAPATRGIHDDAGRPSRH
jgi:hypothetical protein